MIGGNVTEYICVVTWDPKFKCTRYHWVHKSNLNPNEFVKNLNPTEIIF